MKKKKEKGRRQQGRKKRSKKQPLGEDSEQKKKRKKEAQATGERKEVKKWLKYLWTEALAIVAMEGSVVRSKDEGFLGLGVGSIPYQEGSLIFIFFLPQSRCHCRVN